MPVGRGEAWDGQAEFGEAPALVEFVLCGEQRRGRWGHGDPFGERVDEPGRHEFVIEGHDVAAGAEREHRLGIGGCADRDVGPGAGRPVVGAGGEQSHVEIECRGRRQHHAGELPRADDADDRSAHAVTDNAMSATVPATKQYSAKPVSRSRDTIAMSTRMAR